jgi:putative tricarboxylic transport membrane protein
VTRQEERASVDVERAVAFGLLAAVGGYAFVMSFDYGWFNEGNRVGPGLVPAATGGLVCLVSVVLLVSTLMRREPTRADGLAQVAGATTDDGADVLQEEHDDVDMFGRTPAERVRQLWMVTAGLLVALWLVGFVGLLPALGLFCLFASIVVERRPWLPAVVVTAISLAAAYAVFVVFLEVPLPTGYLGFGG